MNCPQIMKKGLAIFYFLQNYLALFNRVKTIFFYRYLYRPSHIHDVADNILYCE